MNDKQVPHPPLLTAEMADWIGTPQHAPEGKHDLLCDALDAIRSGQVVCVPAQDAEADRRNAERFRFALKQGWPRPCYNPDANVHYWYMVCNEDNVFHKTAVDALDAALAASSNRGEQNG